MIHYLLSFFSVLLTYHNEYYIYKFKDLRLLSSVIATSILSTLTLSLLIEVYLLFFSQNIVAIMLALFMGYVLLMSMTIIPEAVSIFFLESQLNIFARSDTYSVPGEYFSIFEFICEALGVYDDDLRLINWVKELIQGEVGKLRNIWGIAVNIVS